MGKMMNFLRGTVTVVASGPFPERLMNLCAQRSVPFWGVVWLDETTVRLTTRRGCLARLRELAQRVGCEMTLEEREGLPFFLARFRRRYAFLVGLALSLAAVSVLSSFVLVVEVEGNERVPTAVILTQLRRQGLRPGAYGPGLDRREMAQEALSELEELSWMSINLQGTRVTVLVREVIPAPELAEEDGFYHITAQADGIVLHLEPERGEAAVEEGDTVAKGEVLISGLMTIEPPQYSDLPTRYYQTRARGRVWARTWRTLTASIPVTTHVKDYTGEDRTLWSVTVFGQRKGLYGDASVPWPSNEKTVETYQPSLPGLGKLPLSLTAEYCRAYEPVQVEIDLEAAQALLEEQLDERLSENIGEEGQVLSEQYTAQVAQGKLTVTLNAECREEIGEETPGKPSDVPEDGALIEE